MVSPVPFSRCWWVTDSLLAGPVFFGGSDALLIENMDALEEAGIKTIVSLVSLEEFYLDDDECDEVACKIADRFYNRGFALPDGSAPDKETMQVMLAWIDVTLSMKGKAYVHCVSGRGRTGTVVGCWLARHGIARGQELLDHLNTLRLANNLSIPCPETDAQRELVTRWRKGQ